MLPKLISNKMVWKCSTTCVVMISEISRIYKYDRGKHFFSLHFFLIGCHYCLIFFNG